MQKLSPPVLVSLSFAFSCNISSANWSFWFLVQYLVLYSLWGLPSRALISFLAFLSYSSFFLLKSDWCFLLIFSIWYSKFFWFCSLILSIFCSFLILALKQYCLYLSSQDWVIDSFVLFVITKKLAIVKIASITEIIVCCWCNFRYLWAICKPKREKNQIFFDFFFILAIIFIRQQTNYAILKSFFSF